MSTLLSNLAPAILFAPGAGAPSTSDWMKEWRERLSRLGAVTTMDYPYALAGKKRPDPTAKLVAAHGAALRAMRDAAPPGAPTVLAGKSMGSRMGCHLAVAEPGCVDALICFGYPLRSAQTNALRDEVLRALTTPIFFVQGTRDPLCPLEDLARVREGMRAPNEVFVVDTGDHSLLVTAAHRKAHGVSQAQVDDRILDAVSSFLERTIDSGAR